MESSYQKRLQRTLGQFMRGSSSNAPKAHIGVTPTCFSPRSVAQVPDCALFLGPDLWLSESCGTSRAYPGFLSAYVESSHNPITTLTSVEAFTFFPLRIPRIVLRSMPVTFAVLRNPRALISAIKLSLPSKDEGRAFTTEEIILILHDENMDGRLFRMKAW